MIRHSLIFVFLLTSSIASANNCGDVRNVDIGPWDYSDPENHVRNVDMVERRHFTPKVENLRGGESTSEIMVDLAYTLTKFPNHYRALHTVIRYDEKLGGVLPPVSKYDFPQTVDCYFDRAFQFKPDDPYLYQLYGIYFFKKENYEKAMENFKKSKELKPSPEADYNLGLVYFEMGDLENARLFAEKAYAADFPIAGLKNKLLDKGIELK